MEKQINLKFFQNNSLLKEEIILCNFLNNNVLSFEFEGCINTIDLENKTFTRQSKSYIFALNIDKNTSCVKLIQNNSEIPIKVCYSVLVKKEEMIMIKYLLDSDAGEIKLEINLEESI